MVIANFFKYVLIVEKSPQVLASLRGACIGIVSATLYFISIFNPHMRVLK